MKGIFRNAFWTYLWVWTFALFSIAVASFIVWLIQAPERSDVLAFLAVGSLTVFLVFLEITLNQETLPELLGHAGKYQDEILTTIIRGFASASKENQDLEAKLETIIKEKGGT